MELPRETQEFVVREACAEAEKAASVGEDAFGAVLADAEGLVVFRAHCTQLRDSDRTAHAEMNLIRAACKELGTQSLAGFVLAANAEPCSMCLSAAIKAKIDTYCYGARAGEGMDPHIRAGEMVARSRLPLTLYADVLREECEGQITRARNAKKST